MVTLLLFFYSPKMIYFDDSGFPVDQTCDGGDSSVRAGLLETFEGRHFSNAYFRTSGQLVRHPSQSPWSNSKNFSRDQLIVKMTGIWRHQENQIAGQIFWSHARRLFFCQNVERDVPGSRKFPWPHQITVGDSKDLGRWRLFDFADILMPDQIWHLIRCARIRWLSVFAVIGAPWLVLSLWGHSRSRHKEHNQIICQCWVAGRWAVSLFKRWVPSWKNDLEIYWGSRNEIEYAKMIIKSLEAVRLKNP
jgi:hypothetical protein